MTASLTEGGRSILRRPHSEAHVCDKVPVAFKDVEDRLSALRLLADQSSAQRRSVESVGRASVLTDMRDHNGYASQLELPYAPCSALRSRSQALQVRAAQYQATVRLIHAPADGWVEVGNCYLNNSNKVSYYVG